MSDIYSLLPRYPSAPIWHMEPAARDAGTGIAEWDMPDLSVPYPNNIYTAIFLLAFTRRTRFLPYARPVIIYCICCGAYIQSI